ncbi:DUF3107 domain-containing protein [Propioniciclava coleopterorum]|uniref:DUF3107 domain-containing protein n=1 Tax=Propioniciclava coleopterorum TaxID=2714937 RepID=A0A6G7Y901_9ACTN|nr:DUF3107 domain-containing protein [Propioniciclava coleopterorum]QIK73273.1 DUF3107 domain-containing protein [Propioniciclava coleopterorum]
MEIKVGVRDVPREVIVETNESGSAIEAALAEALKEQGLLTLTDEKGRKVIIPAAQIAYVELGSEHTRAVGFGAVNN